MNTDKQAALAYAAQIRQLGAECPDVQSEEAQAVLGQANTELAAIASRLEAFGAEASSARAAE